VIIHGGYCFKQDKNETHQSERSLVFQDGT